MMDNAVPLGFALVAGVLAVLTSFAVRRIGAPGTGLLCAVLIGTLLGPTVLGRTAPSLFEQAWIGSEQELAQLDLLDAEYGAWMHLVNSQAMESPATDVDVIVEKQRTWQARRNEILDRHHDAPRLLVLALAFLIVMTSFVRRRSRSRIPGSFLLAAWLAVACGGIVILVDRFAPTTTSQTSMIWIAAGVAVAASVGSTARPRRAVLFSSAQFATALALVALAISMPLLGASFWPPLLLLAAALLGLAFSTSSPAVSVRLERIASTVLAPAVVAITLLDIDLFFATRFAWVPIAAWLAMSDLRWFVALMFLRCRKRSLIHTAIEALPLMGVGWLAVAVLGVGFWTKQLGEVGAVWLLFAAVLAELEGNWRHGAARTLAMLRKPADSSSPGTIN